MEFLRVNSADRHHGTPANFVAELHSPISGTYELESAVIPHTMPPVSASNDALAVVYQRADDAPLVATKTVGVNDSLASLLVSLKTALDTMMYTHTFTVDAETQVITMTLTSSSAFNGLSVTYYAAPDNPASTLASTLGLHATKTVVASTSGTAILFDGPVVLGYPLYYDIRVQGASNSIGDTLGRSADLIVPIDGNTGDIIIYSSRTGFSQRLRITKPTRSLSIRLCDRAGNDVPRASDYSFVLRKL